jgi:2-amino-4-hydroxy-6-hydroxymethyldihydropteridine diphosphokinase
MEANRAILLLGSNIEREKNIRLALDFLRQHTCVLRQSGIWETEAIGSDGPNFLNVALEIATDLDAASIKSEPIHTIEQQLGRVRTGDKNAPRTIDVDLIVYNDQVLDDGLWTKSFVAQPVSELIPTLTHPDNGKSLGEIAAQLKSSAFAEPYPFL